MEDIHDYNAPSNIESDQLADTFQYKALAAIVEARLLSQRSREARLQQLPCQDYARAMSNQKGTTLCFCVCDGVGSSYRGDFAAYYLSQRLIDWLCSLKTIPHSSFRCAKLLSAHLRQWAQEGQASLEQQGIPLKTPALVREVLTELRDSAGSQTMFLCGRIDLQEKKRTPSPSYPARAIFCWMGNVTGYLLVNEGKFITLGDQSDDSNRWSTTQGQQGRISFRTLALKSIDRLIIYTDGLNSIGNELIHLNDFQLEAAISHLLTLPASDDMTLLDLQWYAKSSIKKREQSHE